ncbi:Vms1/Ankzf1 family peptidyl-tRNA hydrolase [Chloroflexota bacterium]
MKVATARPSPPCNHVNTMDSDTSIKRYFLKREEMIRFLGRLEAPDNTAKSLYIPSESLAKRLSEKHDLPPEIVDLAVKSKTGVAVFWSVSQGYAVIPPFPLTATHSTQGYDTKPLLAMLEYDFRVALVLVRLGSYAIGLCQGENLVASKVGTGLVHGRHKKGGSSQQRFQRHRDKQIESFLTRVCSHAREILESHVKTVDYITYGGAWTTILSLQKICPFLHQIDISNLPPLLDIGEPRQKILETAIGRVWSSGITEWHNERKA